MPTTTPDLYARVYARFDAPVTRFDCGRMCSPHNGGEPVCCSTDHAVPIVDRAEYRLLRGRSDLWRRYRPADRAGQKIVEELHRSCVAVECKGARACERENRSLACRAFPFFPYFERGAERFVGLAYYWDFEDRCWVISNLGVVDRGFVREFVDAFELMFAESASERQEMIDHSATMRRIFTRRDAIIPLVGRDGGYLAVEPRTHLVRPARLEEFKRFGPYRDAAPLASAAD
jgi:Fe-S-cluster containining protein